MQAASQKAPASTRNARGRPVAGVSSHLRKSFSAIRAPCKRQAVERHPRDGPSPSSRATGRKPPAPIAAPGGTAPTRNRDAATVSPRFAREHSRETVGVGAGVRREHFRETAAVDAGIRKTPPRCGRVPLLGTRASRPLPFFALPRRPNRPSDALGALSLLALGRFAAEQLGDAIGVLQVLKPRLGGQVDHRARRSTAPRGGSTRGSRA